MKTFNATSGEKLEGKKVSVVIPIFNEEDNIGKLYDKINNVLGDFCSEFEIIFVDDGSQDHSFKVLTEISDQDNQVKIIKFKTNFGQSAAMMAGIQIAKGSIIVTMDGDLQNDPADIPQMIAKLQDGFDMVCGWRRNRKDSFWLRKVPSSLANILISWFSGKKLHDYGCTLRAYVAESIKDIIIMGEMHRFIPALIVREGGLVTEVIVNHYPRQAGKSKYGMERVFKVLLDLFLFKFMSGYATRPIHFFGMFSLTSIGLGFLVGFITLYSRFIVGIPGIDLIPLVLLTMLLILLGGQTIFIGLLAEISIRTYFEAQGKPTYKIDKIFNDR